ncbi:MAG: hypothetical protein JW774_07230 [Candidatus Aureabacteria bacterium]|nr:hypothetical protein [Candidatus Auribacterota bacterium]
MKIKLNLSLKLLFIFYLCFPVSAQDDELKALREAAENEAIQETANESDKLEEMSFKSGGLCLQALNPEISVTGDLIGTYYFGDAYENDHYDWNFRGLGLHFETYLDPYSKFKAAVPVSSEGAELGEAYFTRYGILGGGNLTLGKFRQQFGVINRWHKHGLDFFDFPLPIRMIFGPGGLNQTGISIDWLNSFSSTSQEITLQITDGENGMIHSGNSKKRPDFLLHYKNYRDLTSSTYLELGITGLMAWNDEWNILRDSVPLTINESFSTKVYGLDFTILWEPTDRMRYRNFEIRTELYLCQKDIQAYDGSGADSINALGWYISLNTKISRTVDIGMHIDYYKPDNKPYAELEGYPYYPHAVSADDANRLLTAVYLTWFQSPFVKFRLEYDHEEGSGMGETENRFMFQTVFAAGPHKHERY